MARPPSIASLVLSAVGLAAGAYGLAATVRAANDGLGVRRTPVVDAVRRAAPAVVSVTTENPGRRGGTERGTGGGVIVHPSGYVVTNSHVVRGVSRIMIETSKALGGPSLRYDAALVEDDPGHDLALLKVSRAAPFPYVGLRRTEDVAVGETAVAIGNPYGLGDSITVGVVSALGRSAGLPSGISLRNLIQTDASINFGNSGGALLDLEGDLLGVNCSVHPQAQGIAFAVPADQVKALLDRNLVPSSRATPSPPVAREPASPPRDSGPSAVMTPSPTPLPAPTPVPAPAPRASSSRPSIGLTLRNDSVGVLVAAVEALSPAEIAGIVAGDVIVDVDAVPASSAADTAATFRAAPRGKTFLLTIARGSRRTKVVLVVPTV